MVTQNKNGFSLLTILIIMFVLELGLASTMKLAYNAYSMVEKEVRMEQAMYGAEAGIEKAAAYIALHAGYMPPLVPGGGTNDTSSFSYLITTATDSSGMEVSSIYCEGQPNADSGETRAVTLSGVRTATYAEFSLWSRDNQSLYFTSEETFGKVHSDDILYFSCSDGKGPTFLDEVTSASDRYATMNNSGHSVFNTDTDAAVLDDVNFDSTFELNQAKGSMADVDFGSLKSLAAGDNALLLSGKTWIEFDDDVMYITNSRKGWNNKETSVDDYDLIYVKKASGGSSKQGKLYLEGGTLDGQITIATEDDIKIEGSITYAATPINDEGEVTKSDDALGLLSGQDVVVERTGHDIDIQASIMATGLFGSDGSFYVEDYNYGSPNGSINLIGGIIQDVRGPVGTFWSSNGEQASGYSKNYIFDSRFAKTPPPYYPALEGELTYVSWAESTPDSSLLL